MTLRSGYLYIKTTDDKIGEFQFTPKGKKNKCNDRTICVLCNKKKTEARSEKKNYNKFTKSIKNTHTHAPPSGFPFKCFASIYLQHY